MGQISKESVSKVAYKMLVDELKNREQELLKCREINTKLKSVIEEMEKRWKNKQKTKN